MSLKQKNEISIWAFKDGKKGHEKQTEALIYEFKKSKKISVLTIDCEKSNFINTLNAYFKGLPSMEIDEATDNWVLQDFNITSGMTPFGPYPDLLIGAGSKTHLQILLSKKLFPNAKSIVLMKPSLKPVQLFDFAVVPHFDRFYLNQPTNVLSTNGVLSKYAHQEVEKKTGLAVIGGESRHYHFRPKILSHQIELIVNEFFKDFKWKITTSPRSPNLDIPKHKSNAKFYSWKDTSQDWLSNEMKKSEVTFLTPESVSVLYEALSTKTKTYVFDQELFSNGQYGPRKTKVTKNIDQLKKTGAIGFISSKRNLLSRSIKTADIKHPNNRQPLCEVKDVAIKLLDLL